jgi:adenosine kinase
MNIYVSGSMAYDRIMDFPGKFSDYILPDKIHVLNVCFNVNGLSEKFGGTAGNIAYTLSLLRETPVILATIGRDHEQYFAWLQKNSIPVDAIKIIPEELTAGAYITTDMADNQITGFNPGAMKYPSRYSFDDSNSDRSLLLIAPGNLEDMSEYASQSRLKGIRYICDPGQSLTKWDGKALREWIEGSMMLISNDYELDIILKMSGLQKKDLLALTGTIITTLGDRGSLISTAASDEHVPSIRVDRVLDPTGAGDAFRAGLLKGLADGKDMRTSARLGSVAAAYAIEHYGTQEHHFRYDEFLERYRGNFGAL